LLNETTLKLKQIEQKHLEQINNPKINEDDNLYDERMILLVHEKTNWHLYYDPKYDYVYSIAVVPGAKSSTFGNVSYFKRWYSYKIRNSKTMLCLTDKAVELLGI
jgi:hypothetical protein